MVSPASHRVSVPRATQDSDSIAPDFVYGTLTLSGQPFQCCSSILRNFPIGPSTPYQLLSLPARFGLLRFRSPLLTESFLFLRVLRCFTSPSSPSMTMCSSWIALAFPRAGFPIRISAAHSLTTTPRSFSQWCTSFFGLWCLGIHHMPFVA